MKNLRKVLAMVLVVVMAFSLVTVASAATPKVQDYKDASSIKYTEAVDLFTAIGVLNGIDGNFNPTANVTREQAAKILTYMLVGATAADGLKASTSSFSDVAATRWSAGAIQYCVTKGIINGMGDGTFAPEGNVTATQFAKMLLTAIGYGKNGEYTGSNWEINVITDATRLQILNLDVDFTAAATREQIAQYAFNAYTTVKLVAYSKDTSDYVEKAVTLATQQGVTSQSAGTPNGISSHKWAKNGITLNGNVYANSVVKVLYTGMGKGLTGLTTVGNTNFVAAKDDTVTYFKNGVASTYDALKAKIDVDMTAFDMGYTAAGGYIMQLVDSDEDGLVDKVLVTEKTVALLTGDAVLNTTTGKVSVPGAFANQDKVNVTGWEGLKKGDVVLFYKDSENVYHVEKCKSVTGQLTNIVGGLFATFNGSMYLNSGLPGTLSDFATLSSSYTNFNADATIWLDGGNNIVRFKLGEAAAKTYAVLVGYDYNGMTGVATAKLVKEDGTTAIYTVAADASGTVLDQSGVFAIPTSGAGTYGYLVSYVVDANGKVTLTPAATTRTIKTESPVVGATSGYDAKDATIKTTLASNSTYYITGTTTLFYFDTTKAYNNDSTSVNYNPVKVTSGYGSTAAVAAGTVITIATADDTSTVLKSVLMPVAGASVGTSDKYAFVASMLGTSPTVTYSGSVATYTYTVLVDGVSTQLKSTSPDLFKMYFAADTLYPGQAAGMIATSGIFRYTVGANGYVLATYQTGKLNSTSPTNTEARILTPYSTTETVESSYIVLANGNVIFTDSNTKFYLVNTSPMSAGITEQAIGESTASTHYTVTGVLLDKDHVADNLADVVYYTYTVG